MVEDAQAAFERGRARRVVERRGGEGQQQAAAKGDGAPQLGRSLGLDEEGAEEGEGEEDAGGVGQGVGPLFARCVEGGA